MSSVKTVVDPPTVKQFIQQKFGNSINDFQFIKGGQLSQAFSFTSGKNDYVIKVRKDLEALEKESSIFEHLSRKNPSIPLPKIYDLGIFQDSEEPPLYYCITEKCDGKMLYDFSFEELEKFETAFVEILFNIHQVDISETEQYGDWVDFKKANYQTWAKFLEDYIESKAAYLKDFFSDNTEEFVFIKKLEDRIKELLPYCSEERSLIHGDYGLHNALGTASGEITGIIDWEISKFGDFVYDVAWLEFWAYYDKQTYVKAYQEIYKARKGKKIENYEERLQCYTLCVVLHMEWFNCKSGQLKAYQEMKKRVRHL